jgi:hypothetical protein
MVVVELGRRAVTLSMQRYPARLRLVTYASIRAIKSRLRSESVASVFVSMVVPVVVERLLGCDTAIANLRFTVTSRGKINGLKPAQHNH